MRSIAQGLWGDGEMWWMLAQSNNLDENSTLVAGQVLTVPNKVTNIHNNANTFRPYNPGEVIGYIDPTLPSPPPPPDKGCGGIGTIIMVIVAVVVTIYTAGAAAVATSAASGSAGTFAAGMTVLSGGAGLTGAAIGAAAIGGAVGSAASQLVGMATGNVQSFSFKQMALSAAGSAISAGVGAGLNATGVLGSTAPGAPAITAEQAFGRAVIGAAASSAATQVVQGRWSWREIAASAVGGVAGGVAGQATSGLGKFASSFSAGLAGGLASEAVRRTDPGYQRGDLTNLFLSSVGSAIGAGVVDAYESQGLKTFDEDSVKAINRPDTGYLGSVGLIDAQFVGSGVAVGGYTAGTQAVNSSAGMIATVDGIAREAPVDHAGTVALDGGAHHRALG